MKENRLGFMSGAAMLVTLLIFIVLATLCSAVKESHRRWELLESVERRAEFLQYIPGTAVLNSITGTVFLEPKEVTNVEGVYWVFIEKDDGSVAGGFTPHKLVLGQKVIGWRVYSSSVPEEDNSPDYFVAPVE